MWIEIGKTPNNTRQSRLGQTAVAHRHRESITLRYGISKASSTTTINFPSSSNNHFSSQQPLSLITLFQTRLSDQPNTFKMAFFKSLIIASVAAVALAQGASDKNTKVDVDSQSGAPKCGNGQKIACCNSGEDLIGLNCLSVPIRKLTLQSYLQHKNVF